jgi:hypothetical protein
MSKGLGNTERIIVNYFTECTTAHVEELARMIYVRGRDRGLSPASLRPDQDFRVTRAALVATRRAVKRLQQKGWPVKLCRLNGVRGRPLIAFRSPGKFRPSAR